MVCFARAAEEEQRQRQFEDDVKSARTERPRLRDRTRLHRPARWCVPCPPSPRPAPPPPLRVLMRSPPARCACCGDRGRCRARHRQQRRPLSSPSVSSIWGALPPSPFPPPTPTASVRRSPSCRLRACSRRCVQAAWWRTCSPPYSPSNHCHRCPWSAPSPSPPPLPRSFTAASLADGADATTDLPACLCVGRRGLWCRRECRRCLSCRARPSCRSISLPVSFVLLAAPSPSPRSLPGADRNEC